MMSRRTRKRSKRSAAVVERNRKGNLQYLPSQLPMRKHAQSFIIPSVTFSKLNAYHSSHPHQIPSPQRPTTSSHTRTQEKWPPNRQFACISSLPTASSSSPPASPFLSSPPAAPPEALLGEPPRYVPLTPRQPSEKAIWRSTIFRPVVEETKDSIRSYPRCGQ